MNNLMLTYCIALIAKCLFSHTSQRAQLKLRAPLSPLQTAWTGFDPNLYSGGSSSASPALVVIATARSFILNRGIVTDTMSATPLYKRPCSCYYHQSGACWSGAERVAIQ